jgi:isopenicillin N synthase-like dioxygenase
VSVPAIDVAPLVTGTGDAGRVADAIDTACRETGFFSIVGHGVDPKLRARLARLAREFFALDDSEKAAIEMARGGNAWRGWFPVGSELTAGIPDQKEGIYFGAELPPSNLPLHGPNLSPARPAGLRATVLEYLDALTAVGHAVLRGIALARGLDEHWFAAHITRDPVILFRIFHYPPTPPGRVWEEDEWGVREHTDYGLLTILGQDGTGGLEVKSREGWVDVPPDPDAFVCNLGDMLERMTNGEYRSTPHRVRNASGQGRLSFPFFFDPSWDAQVPNHDGTYGEYLVAKVSNVFPDLKQVL